MLENMKENVSWNIEYIPVDASPSQRRTTTKDDEANALLSIEMTVD